MKDFSAMVRDIPDDRVAKVYVRRLFREHTAGYSAIANDRVFSRHEDHLKEINSRGPLDQITGDHRKTLHNLHCPVATGDGLKDSWEANAH